MSLYSIYANDAILHVNMTEHWNYLTLCACGRMSVCEILMNMNKNQDSRKLYAISDVEFNKKIDENLEDKSSFIV